MVIKSINPWASHSRTFEEARPERTSCLFSKAAWIELSDNFAKCSSLLKCPVAWLVVSFGVILGQRPLNPHNYVALHGRLLRQTNSRLWSHDNGAGNQHKAMDMISSCAPFDGPSVPLIWLLKILTIVWPVSCARSSGALSSQWVLDLLRLFWSFLGVKWSQPMLIHWGLNFPRRCHMMQQSSSWQWNSPLHLQPLGKCLTEQQLQWDLNASRTYHEDPLIKSNHIIIMLQRYAVVLHWIEQFWCQSLRWRIYLTYSKRVHFVLHPQI